MPFEEVKDEESKRSVGNMTLVAIIAIFATWKLTDILVYLALHLTLGWK